MIFKMFQLNLIPLNERRLREEGSIEKNVYFEINNLMNYQNQLRVCSICTILILASQFNLNRFYGFRILTIF